SCLGRSALGARAGIQSRVAFGGCRTASVSAAGRTDLQLPRMGRATDFQRLSKVASGNRRPTVPLFICGMERLQQRKSLHFLFAGYCAKVSPGHLFPSADLSRVIDT